jgi:hypothetical protein
VKSVHSERAKQVFRVGQGAPFLEHIQQIDKEAPIRLPLGTRRDSPRPSFTFVPAQTEACYNPGSGVSSGARAPGRADDLVEPSMQAPGRLIAE